MNDDARRLLQTLLETPSPSGYERPIQQVVRDYVTPFADRVTTDVHGNVIACRHPTAPLRVMFAGHCDQIGMLVTQIDDSGFLYAETIGGWDSQQLIGQRMTIWTKQGQVAAIIARKPIHLLNEQERKQVVKLEELWLDIGARDKSEAAAIVRIGDPVTLELGFQAMRNQLANAPGMDDKSGLWVVLEALRRAGATPLSCALFAVSTVQEEIGLRGAKTSAYDIDPQVAIAVDVTHATDCPTIDKRQRGEICLGKGPVIFRGPNMNPVISERLMSIADRENIPYQLAASGRASSNDANSLQISRGGVATGVVAIPNRYMHSAVETISLEDLDYAADLLAHFARDLRPTDDFTP
ncbi:MAG: M42 family metallopeptidase [Pirellulaceae bacterium]